MSAAQIRQAEVASPFYQVGSLHAHGVREQRGDGGHYDCVRIALGERAYTTLDKYETQALIDALTRWMAST